MKAMVNLPANFRKIRLELAREPGHPDGDSHTGYEFVAPLDDDGRLDPDAWSARAANCVVRGFAPDRNDRRGLLRYDHKAGWYFDYDPQKNWDDERGFRLDAEVFERGEYVSLADDDERTHTYRIVAIEYV
jgi:glycosyltransferase involved in cell wall biosynthesis